MNQKEASVGRWQKEFFENIKIFINDGKSEEESKKILEKFLYLSSITPMPNVMKVFQNPEALEEVGVYTQAEEKTSDFMMSFLSPIMKRFSVEGKENLECLVGLNGKLPVTLVSNHLSHLDAPAIYQLLYNCSDIGKKIAKQLVFIAGRLAFEPDFTRLGLYMFGTLLVCSKKDMSDNPSLSDLMTKINMRAFRQSQKLQSEGKIISIFPEGTRSRDGKLMPFVDTVYHYVANKIILPISLEGTDKILPTSGFLFNQAKGKLVIGKPVLLGELTKKQMEFFPKEIEQISLPGKGDKKQFLIDNLALLVGSNLSKHKHGSYRNLYKGNVLEKNVLIQIPKNPTEKIVVIGSSNMSVPIATSLANQDVIVTIYNINKEIVDQSNMERRDVEHYPLYKLPPNLSFSSSKEIIQDASFLVQGANSWELDSIYPEIISEVAASKAPMLNVMKGFTNSESGLILNDLEQKFGFNSNRLAVMSGASYPDQIMERKISGFEIAAVNESLIPKIQSLFSTGYIFPRPAIIKNDVKGVQLGGALKSVYALAMGVVEGYYKNNLGGNVDNTLFHLSNRFFKEMVKIGMELGGMEETFNGLSGLTDFMLSCFGSDTRDRKLGNEIAMGNKPEIMSSGYYGLKMLPKLTKLDITISPVITGVYEIVVNSKPVDVIIDLLEKKLQRV